MIESLNRRFALLIVCLLSGCAISQTVPPDYRMDNTAGKGLIVGTISQTRVFYGDKPSTTLLFRRKGSQAGINPWLRVASANFSVSVKAEGFDIKRFSSTHSELPDANGRLFAIEVDAGDYELFNFLFRYKNITRYLKKDSPMGFTVRPGEVVYIGNLHMDFELVTRLAVLRTLVPTGATFTDRSERDLPLLLARYPQLSRDQVSVLPLGPSPWEWGDAMSSDVDPVPAPSAAPQ